MSSSFDRAKILARLATNPPKKRLSLAAQVVAEHRNLIRRALRKGHSLQTLATELKLPKRTLQRQLNLAGLFVRTPRTGRGAVIRPYKKRETLA